MRRVRDSIASFKNALKEQSQQQHQQHQQHESADDDLPQQTTVAASTTTAAAAARPPNASNHSSKVSNRSSAPQQQAPQAAHGPPSTLAFRATNEFFRESPSRVTQQLSNLDVSDGSALNGFLAFGKRSSTFKRRFQQFHQDQQESQQQEQQQQQQLPSQADIEQARVAKRRATTAEMFRAAFDANARKQKLLNSILAASLPPPLSAELTQEGIAVGAQWTLARQKLQRTLESTNDSTHSALSALRDSQAALSQLGTSLPRAVDTQLPSFDAWRRNVR